MAITVLPAQRTGADAFVEAFSPYLQMAFEMMLKKKLGEPEEKRAQSAEQRAVEKEKREVISSVSKGEIPITTVPESIRNTIIRGPQINTEGLTGRVNELSNLPPTTQIMGTPEFMQRVTPAETPEQAQARLMSVYAQQQQAINPYRALMAEKLDLWQRAVNGESLTETEKILLGIQAKEDPEKLKLFKMLFPDSDLPIPTPNLTPKPKYNSKTEKLMWSPSQQKYFVVPK